MWETIELQMAGTPEILFLKDFIKYWVATKITSYILI